MSRTSSSYDALSAFHPGFYPVDPCIRPPYTVAFAEMKDVPAMGHIIHTAYPQSPVSMQCGVLERKITDPNAGIFKAVKNDAIEGFLGFGMGSCMSPRAEITHLFVRRKKQGIGKELLNQFFQFAKICGKRDVFLLATIEGAAYYTHLGFQDGSEMEVDAYLQRHLPSTSFLSLKDTSRSSPLIPASP